MRARLGKRTGGRTFFDAATFAAGFLVTAAFLAGAFLATVLEVEALTVFAAGCEGEKRPTRELVVRRDDNDPARGRAAHLLGGKGSLLRSLGSRNLLGRSSVLRRLKRRNQRLSSPTSAPARCARRDLERPSLKREEAGLTSLPAAAEVGFLLILTLPERPLGRAKVPLSAPRLMAVATSVSNAAPSASLYLLRMYLQWGKGRRWEVEGGEGGGGEGRRDVANFGRGGERDETRGREEGAGVQRRFPGRRTGRPSTVGHEQRSAGEVQPAVRGSHTTSGRTRAVFDLPIAPHAPVTTCRRGKRQCTHFLMVGREAPVRESPSFSMASCCLAKTNEGTEVRRASLGASEEARARGGRSRYAREQGQERGGEARERQRD